VKRAALFLLLVALPAQAKTSRELSYGYDRIWPALVRFLRVDERLKLTEKDADAGYVLFELAEGKRTFPGAAELSKITDELGRPAVRLSVKITDRPAYMEAGILDRFAEKIHEELGDPAPPPAAAAPTPDAPPEKK
jgi:hypothetical protein